MVRTSAPTTDSRLAAPAIAAVCPYLLSEDGAWRASTPTRDHRCTAVAPAAVLAPDKQRRLCLTDEHTGCATFRAAIAHGGDPDATTTARAAASSRIGSRALARTAPLVLDHGRVTVAVPTLRGEPRLGQILLIALMGVAFAAILFARIPLGGGTPGGGGLIAGVVATPSSRVATTPRPAAIAEATTAPERTLVPTEAKPTKAPTTSAKPSSKPSAKPAADPTTYKVKRGDTLSDIATKFDTTWQVLAELNDIKDPGSLRVGQVLELP
jgi:LysM repeat protein